VTETAEQTEAQQALELFRAGVQALRAVDVGQVADDALLDWVRAVEVERRRLTTVDHAAVAEVDARHLAQERGCRDTATLLSLLLRVDPGEAKARVAAAIELGWRRTLTGERLPAVFGQTAAACAQGSISAAHARVITEAIDASPLDVQAERDVQIEAFLLEQAQRFAPRELRLIARRLHDTYDQDGRLASDADRERRRCLDFRQHADGCVSGRFHLDPIAGEALLTVLDPLARPAPAHDGTPDPRTPGQRRHDALRDALLLVLRTGELPTAGGVTTTIVLTMSRAQFAALHAPGHQPVEKANHARAPGDGLVRTGHGALLNLERVKLMLGDAQIQPVVLDSVKRIEAYGSAHRYFTAAQRLAMAARDGGCSFPGCTVPAAWSQAHHIVEWQSGGPTSVENGTLLCGCHHRSFEKLGHVCTVINGVPHWIPPAWIDATRTPVRNAAHDPAQTWPEGDTSGIEG